jgi:hypothetical protein
LFCWFVFGLQIIIEIVLNTWCFRFLALKVSLKFGFDRQDAAFGNDEEDLDEDGAEKGGPEDDGVEFSVVSTRIGGLPS